VSVSTYIMVKASGYLACESTEVFSGKVTDVDWKQYIVYDSSTSCHITTCWVITWILWTSNLFKIWNISTCISFLYRSGCSRMRIKM